MDLANYTIPAAQSFGEVCNLNQLALIEQTNKMPSQALTLALLVFVALLIHFWIIPYFKSWKYYDYIEDAFSGFAFAMSIMLVMLLIILTIQLSEEQIHYYTNLGYYIFVPLIIIRVGYLLYTHRNNIKGLFQEKVEWIMRM